MKLMLFSSLSMLCGKPCSIFTQFHYCLSSFPLFSFFIQPSHIALLGQWFQDEEHEAALSLLQVAIAIGFVISFVGGIYLNTETRLWIITAFILLSSITYTLVFFLTSCNKQQLLPCLYRGTVDERESGTDKKEENDTDIIQDYEITGNGSPWNRFNPLSTRPSVTVRDSHKSEEEKKEIEAREDEEGMRNGSSRFRNFKQSSV